MASKASIDSTRLKYLPDSQLAISRGVATLERVIGPTIGPFGRPVAISRVGRTNTAPELIDDGATIARRMIGLEDRFDNMGFMLARQAAWRQRVEAGDGTASTVAILAEGHRYLRLASEAGANRIELLADVHCATDRVIKQIRNISVELAPSDRKNFVQSACPDDRIAEIIIEANELLGPDATVVTRESTARNVSIEYVEGALWESTSKLSPFHADSAGGSIRMANPAILLWDAAINQVDEATGLLESLKSLGKSRVVIMARSFSGEVLGLIQRNIDAGLELEPVKAPHSGRQQAWAFEDLAALTGAEILRPEAGNSLNQFDQNACGVAQRVTVGPRFLNVMVPRSHQPRIDRQIEQVRRLMEQEEEENIWNHYQLRLGRLQQGMGVIWVGAPTESARDVRSRMAAQNLSRLRAATAHGIVPGGGASLLLAGCAMAQDQCLKRHPGIRAVMQALERPAWWIARNSGYEPATVVARSREYAPDQGFDARTGKFVTLFKSGIADPVSTVTSALEIGLSMAALACDTSVLVKREVSLERAELKP